MTTLVADILAEARQWLGLEGLAVIGAVVYLLLAIRQNIACWLFAAISTAIYVYLFLVARLYMESALNAFYFAMAIYGWYSWRSGNAGAELEVCRWPASRHAVALIVIVLLTLVSGSLLERHTAAAFPYADSATTWGALWATFLLARKVLENWWYWLAIDTVSVVIYWARDLELTALLFVVYIVMIPFGYLSWRASMREASPQ